MPRLVRISAACATLAAAILVTAPQAAAGLQAGAAASNITPPLGEPIIGGFHPFPATHVHDELQARCLVLDDGTTRLALVVCDLLGLHNAVSDEARRLIAAETGIPPDHVLVCATHTHSATSALGAAALERFDVRQPALTPYQAFVARRIADGVRRATNLARPAELAWGTVEVPEHLFNRRWFMRPGTMPENPFGTATDLVKMNPPAGSPNLDRPAGPTDPTLPFFVVREPAGPPIGLFAAYSLHYVGGVGTGHVSADYFGVVCDELARLFAGEAADDRAGSPFVALLANGASGDVNNIDFRKPRPPSPPYERIEAVGRDVAGKIHAAAGGLEYRREVPLAARFREPEIGARRPTAEELAWARRTLEGPSPAGERKSLAEIYAERVLALERQPDALPLPLQLLAIGDGRLGTMPCEVFTEIGLEFRQRCAGRPTTLVSLAHGYLGYLPTPRQHDFGGYETWPGTNRLARDASETMLEALLEMAAELPPPAAHAAAAPPSPEDARSALRTDPGIVVELAAAELVQALAGIATAAANDRWTRAAVASACSSRAGAVLAAVVANATPPQSVAGPGEPGACDSLVAELAELAAAGGEDVLPAVAALQGQPPAGRPLETALVAGLGRGLVRRRSSLEAASREWPAASRQWLRAVFARATELAADASGGEAERVAAIGVLAQAGFATAGPALAALVRDERAEAVRLAAIAGLASRGDSAADASLVSDEFPRWLAGGTPAVRRALVEAACARPARADRLVGLVERGLIPQAALSAEQWNRLGGLGDAGFRDRVARLREVAAPDRLAVIAAYEPALGRPGDVSRGRVVFGTHCAGCHRVGDLGVNVGPDISDSRTRQPSQYLVDILDPNRAIDANYFVTTVVLTDGRVMAGIIAAETPGSLTLRRQDGATVTLLETEIEELTTAAVSFMPVGLERGIDLSQMADLIAFLKGWRYAALR